MKSYFLLFTTAVLMTLGLTPLVRRWAIVWGAMDHPDGLRRIHQRPTPRLGGLSIFLSVLITLACVPLFGNLVSNSLREHWPDLMVVLGAGTLVLLLGVWDDFRGSKATIKIAVQLLAAGILYGYGYRIDHISMPAGAGVHIPSVFSFLLTGLWVVGITNAFNLIDGIDGLAAGASGFALLSLFICSLANGHPEISLLSIIMVGGVIGFLRYNFNPASIFLGDTGSLFLGFMAAALSLKSAQKGSTLVAIAIPLVSFGLPVTEVGLSVVRRVLSGAPVFQSDRRHIHHMLLHRGLNQRQAVILLYAICAVFSLFGIMLLNPQRSTTGLILFVLGASLMLGVRQLGYAEFGALGRHIRQGVSRHRRALANGSRWEQDIEALHAARNLDELSAALTRFCEANGFAAARLDVASSTWNWQWTGGQILPAESDGISNPLQNCSLQQCWVFRFPLVASDGLAVGSFTLYHSPQDDLSKDHLTFDLANAGELLRRELSLVVNKLPCPTAHRERALRSRDYLATSAAAVGRR
jgi:UDP-GlcNAc:undecaprenyl-phosphate GlcNAc-1-phosphate transferase